MYPHERSLVQRMEGKPFVLLGVNSDPKKNILEAMKRENITWPFFWDGGNTNGPIAKKYKVEGWPTIFVLDGNGVIRYKNVRGEKMDKAVDELLKEMEEQKKAEPTTKPSDT
jgi:peroxiredoxin